MSSQHLEQVQRRLRAKPDERAETGRVDVRSLATVCISFQIHLDGFSHVAISVCVPQDRVDLVCLITIIEYGFARRSSNAWIRLSPVRDYSMRYPSAVVRWDRWDNFICRFHSQRAMPSCNSVRQHQRGCPPTVSSSLSSIPRLPISQPRIPRYHRNRMMPSVSLAIIMIIGLLCHAMSRFKLIRAAACGGGDFGTSKSLITRDCFYPGV